VTVAPQPQPPIDPFGVTANPAAYVPRTATESVLVRLESALREGAGALSLYGPAGSGKTLLLHVLAHRLDGDFQSIYVPYPKLEPDELCQWLLAALNEPGGSDSERAVLARIQRDADMCFPPMLWMIDDAGHLPDGSLGCLVRLQSQARGSLRVLLVRSDGDPAQRFARAGLAIEEVELDGAMSGPELARYVRARLDRAPADACSRVRLEAALDRLGDLSGGNPARLHAAAAALLWAPTLASDDAQSSDTEPRSSATHQSRT